MTAAERLRILGPDGFAEATRIGEEAAAKYPPSPELIEELRPILAPAMARVRARKADHAQQQPAA